MSVPGSRFPCERRGGPTAAQSVGTCVSLDARQYRHGHGQDDHKLGAHHVGRELDRLLRVCLGRGQVATAYVDEGPMRQDGRDGERIAAGASVCQELFCAPPRRVETIGNGKDGERQGRPGVMGLDRKAGRERALGEVAGGGGRTHRHHLVGCERRERRRRQRATFRTVRLSPVGDCGVGLAPRRHRRVGDTQQRDVDPLACGMPGRQAALGAAEDRRSLGCLAAEEEQAAEIDRRRSYGDRILAALGDIRQRSDRLRCTGVGERLAELEQDGGAIAVGRRLVKGAR
jgi:hypothetical protein